MEKKNVNAMFAMIFSQQKFLRDIKETQKKPLGEFSEQVVEAAHQKLDKIWQFYIVKMIETEDHGLAFQKCINHFNSMNM